MKDCSDAVNELITSQLGRHFPLARMLDDRDGLRRDACYTEPIDIILRKHLTALRALFETLKVGRGGATNDLISYEGWMAFAAARLIGPDITERDAILAFIFARRIVINPHNVRGSIRHRHLPFEPFMEALVRLAPVAAMPTDVEIREAHCRDAAEYYEWLRAHDATAFTRLQETRGVAWGEWPTHQPMNRCLDHFLTVVLTRRQQGLSREHKERKPHTVA
mmetsp:Transcript_4805/g.12794  ORF Transcript_4805/g.12794 Transcript_4805/m.12794 type:complete len:221 (+) Transcript_4805:155-817(+)